jgi:raffinose/stachyose/melibiose transport system permease protein
MQVSKPSSTQTYRYHRFVNLIISMALGLLMLLVIMPFFSIFLASLKTPAELVKGALSLPKEWLWSNYADAWTQAHFNDYLANSIIVAVSVVVISTFLSILSAYAFGKMRFRFSAILMAVFLLGIMAPQEAYIVPLYYLVKRIGLIDTYWAMILPQIGMSVCFGTFWLSGFFRNFPRELVDAAKIDGCGEWGILWRVIIPNASAAITTLVVLFFVWTWNDFLIPLVMVSSDALRTLPLGLAFFQGKYSSNVPLIAAGAMIVTLPTLIIYIFFQRKFVHGITAGALQGQ